MTFCALSSAKGMDIKMKYKGLATVYAYLIIDRELTYAEVPKFLKKSVKEMLITLGAEELAMEGTAATDA